MIPLFYYMALGTAESIKHQTEQSEFFSLITVTHLSLQYDIFLGLTYLFIFILFILLIFRKRLLQKRPQN